MKLPRSLVLTLLLSLAPISTITWGMAAQASPLTGRIARQQCDSNDELCKYAAALIEIEPLRLEALNQIQSQVGGQLPELMCHQPSSMDGLPGSAQKIFARYCNRASSIAKKHGLSQDKFNRITIQVANNSQLRRNLQRQVCLQGGGC